MNQQGTSRMTTLREWRESKKWSQAHLANTLSKRLGKKLYQSHVAAWESGSMPGADIGDAIRKLSGGKVSADTYGRKESGSDANQP